MQLRLEALDAHDSDGLWHAGGSAQGMMEQVRCN
jgi:hypothetical protein